MPREVIRRTASDNVYLHKDFHGTMSVGIDYLDRRFGEEAVRDYLHQFALSFYAPLRAELLRDGLPALERHFRKMYEAESGKIEIRLSDDELTIDVAECPAVTHMRAHGYSVARLFYETTKTVNEAICEGTPFAAELLVYEEQNGHAVARFCRRAS